MAFSEYRYSSSLQALRKRFGRDQLQSQLIRGASTAFVINAAGTAAGFLAQLLLTRTLGADGYGIYAWVGAWVVLLATLATLGFRTALLRLVPSYRGTEDWGHLRGVSAYAERRVGLAGAIVALFGAAIVILRMDNLGRDLAHALLIGLAIVPLAAFIHLRAATLRGFDRVASALAPDHVLRHVLVVVVVAAMVYGFGYQLTPASAVAILLLATLASLAVMTLSLRNARPASYYDAQPLHTRKDRRSWRRMASSMLVSVGAERLTSETPLLILGALLEPKAVALYAISSRCAGLISFGLMAFNTIFAPTVARLHALDRRHDLQRAVTLTTWMVLGTSSVIAVPMFLLAGYSDLISLRPLMCFVF
jgi:O-antigen/teichoic acid export membrane protein